jgi:hypothetical protein
VIITSSSLVISRLDGPDTRRDVRSVQCRSHTWTEDVATAIGEPESKAAPERPQADAPPPTSGRTLVGTNLCFQAALDELATKTHWQQVEEQREYGLASHRARARIQAAWIGAGRPHQSAKPSR